MQGQRWSNRFSLSFCLNSRFIITIIIIIIILMLIIIMVMVIMVMDYDEGRRGGDVLLHRGRPSQGDDIQGRRGGKSTGDCDLIITYVIIHI